MVGMIRNWESLLTELWIDILLRLSIKDVVVCRSVSKFFHSIIDHPCFAVLHFPLHLDDPLPEGGGYDNDTDVQECEDCNDPNRQCDKRHVTKTNIIVINRPTNNGVIKGGSHVTKYGDVFTPSVTFKFPGEWGDCKCDVVGNVNGMLLLHKYKSRFKNWNSRIELILWNPLTSKTCILPKSPLCMMHDSFVVNQPVKVGFGYDGVHDDYKIVVMVLKSLSRRPRNTSGKAKYRFTVEVYSLRTKSWRAIRFKRRVGLYLGPKINLDGSIIWMAGEFNPNGLGNNYNVDERDCGHDNVDDEEGDVNFTYLVYFNLEAETLLITKRVYQENDQGSKFMKFPLVFNESLAVFHICYEYGLLGVLKNDNSWDIIGNFSIGDEFYYSLLGSRVSNAVIFDTDHSRDVLISLYGRGVLTYNIAERDAMTLHFRADFMDVYVESLLCPSNPFSSSRENDVGGKLL